jgi:hypothetical protein
MWGLSDLVLFEIKVPTYNAQFNFCLLFDRSEFAHSAPLSLRLRTWSRVTNSRIKLSKIVAQPHFRATKNSISAPTLKLAGHL